MWNANTFILEKVINNECISINHICGYDSLLITAGSDGNIVIRNIKNNLKKEQEFHLHNGPI